MALQPISLSLPTRKYCTRVRQRRAHAGVVLVIAGALELDGLAVQQEALLGIERDGANAERRFVAIDDCAADAHLGDELVEIALFERPECGRLHHHLLLVVSARLLPGSDTGAAPPCATALPARIENGGDNTRILRALAVVLDLGADRERSPRLTGPALATNVPHRFTWTGVVFTSQTCR